MQEVVLCILQGDLKTKTDAQKVLVTLLDSEEPHLERALCRRWDISAVICRESGGRTQRIWELVAQKEDIDLWIIARPNYSQDIKIINTVEALLNYVDIFYKTSIN